MKKYILIIGGELFNKGAQAMTFVTVDEMKKRYPDRKVILLSDIDYKRNQKEKDKYLFDIKPMNFALCNILLGGIYKFIWKIKSKEKNKDKYMEYASDLFNIFKDSDIMIDISGYGLSSQWSIRSSIYYLLRVKLAKKHGIKVYIMPQSFGPFKYKGIYKPIMNYLIKKHMKYAKIIYTREKEGYKYLHDEFNLNNVVESKDLVLLNKGINVNNVYKNSSEVLNKYNVDGVAIVPNMRNFDHGNKDQIMRLYETIINKVIDANKNIYLVRHSFEDMEACKLIKERFKNNDKVVLMTDDMSCLEFDEVVKDFDFLIASRFHSIVHAYKTGVPCIALGWATKYNELLSTFKQEKYIFDVRNNIDMKNVENAVDSMLLNYQNESKGISEVLDKLQTTNVFDIIGEV